MDLRDARVEFLEVPLHLIDEPVLPARSRMDEDKLEELTTDVRKKGVLVPISVFRKGDRYEVIAGHRRRLAAGRAGLSVLRCLVYAAQDVGLEAIKWSENRYREEMSPVEEAAYFAELLERDCGGDTNRLSEQVGEKRTFVEGRLLLLTFPPEVITALEDKQIGIGVARQLAKITEKLMRDYYLQICVRDGSTEAVAAGYVQQWQQSIGPGGVPPDRPVAPSAPAAVAQSNYFRCYVCGKDHNVHTMQPINVHNACREAILDPLLGREAPSTT